MPVLVQNGQGRSQGHQVRAQLQDADPAALGVEGIFLQKDKAPPAP